MKTILIPMLALWASMAIAADVVETTTTTTITDSGTISDFAPGQTLIVRDTSGPVAYRCGKMVTYVTKGGKMLTDEEVRSRIKVGVPVHVHYTRDGDARVVSRIEIDED